MRLLTRFFFAVVATAILASVVFVLPASAAPKENSPFVDIAADDPFVAAIAFLKNKSVVKGYPDQTFHPDSPVSRAEFTKMTLALNGRSLDAATFAKISAPFSDVTKDDWFYTPVLTAYKLGFVQGYPHVNSAGKKEMIFSPNATVTRVQALKIAFEGLQFEKFVSNGFLNQAAGQAQMQSVPLDVSPKAWYATYANAARKLHIMTESDDGHFSPDGVVTRAMAAEILYRMQTVANAKGTPFDLTNEWIVSPGGRFALRLPSEWSVRTDGGRTQVLHRDPAMPSPDPELITPFSAYMDFETGALDGGGASSGGVGVGGASATYFVSIKALIKSNFPGRDVRFTDIELLGKSALHAVITGTGEERWYVFDSTSQIIKVRARYGSGPASFKLRDTVRDIVRTMQFAPQSSNGSGSVSAADIEKKIAAVNQKVLVEHAGKVTIDGIGDAVLLETDSIGVGTGPVDYYFSTLLNITLKYERTSDTILAVRAGKTTAF